MNFDACSLHVLGTGYMLVAQPVFPHVRRRRRLFTSAKCAAQLDLSTLVSGAVSAWCFPRPIVDLSLSLVVSVLCGEFPLEACRIAVAAADARNAIEAAQLPEAKKSLRVVRRKDFLDVVDMHKPPPL